MVMSVRGEEVRPMEVADELGVPVKTVRESCRSMADEDLETEPILQREGQAHTYEPAVDLLNLTELEREHPMVRYHVDDVVAEARGEFDDA